MKYFIVVCLALVATVMADVSELDGYDYHGPAVDGGDYSAQDGGYSSSVPSNSYIPPAAPSNTYIPPAEPSNTYIPPATGGSAELGEDGYRYRTQRHRVYRQRV